MAALDIRLPGETSLSSSLYRNLEPFKGQVLTTPPIMSARQEGELARRDIVRAARHVERMSEPVRGGLDRKADMVVGPRLLVRSTPGFDMLEIDDKERQEKIAKAFEREFKHWAYNPRLLQDAEGTYDFGGLAWLLYRNIEGPDGECACVVHSNAARAEFYGTKWSTFVQVFDPDRIETPADKSTNPNVRDGMVFDKWGRRVGMFVRKLHPAESAKDFGDTQYEMIPRETAEGRPVGIHWFVKTRAAQTRGISKLVTILKQSNMLDKFDEVYLGAATLNQVLATYITSGASTKAVSESLAPAGAETSIADMNWALFDKKLGYYEDVKMRIGGTRVPVLPPGDTINMSAVNRAIQDPSVFRNGFLRNFASSVGISFEQISKNFSDANYSAARAALLDVWQGVMRNRFWFGQHVLSLIYMAVLDEAVVNGSLDDVLTPAERASFRENIVAWAACLWTGPGFPQIDPEKEAKAAKMLLEMKIESREEIIAQRGRDIEDVFDEIAREREMAEEREFIIDPLAPGTPMAEEDEATIDPDEGQAPKPKKQQKQQRDGDGDGIVDEENTNADGGIITVRMEG